MLKEFSKGVVREMTVLHSIMSGVRREKIGEKESKVCQSLDEDDEGPGASCLKH